MQTMTRTLRLVKFPRNFSLASTIQEHTPPPFQGVAGTCQKRQELAQAHRLAAHFGWDELTWNHISVREAPGKDFFFVTPGDRMYQEMTAEDVVRNDDTGNVTSDVIHGAIYRARPDVHAIVHTHTTPITTVSCLQNGLEYFTQDSAAFYGRVAYYEWEGMSDDYEEQVRIGAAVTAAVDQDDSGLPHTLIMKNHGAVTTGATLGEAFVRMYYLDRICRTQIELLKTGAAINRPPVGVLESTAKQYQDAFAHGKYEWDALKRFAELGCPPLTGVTGRNQ